MKKTLVIIGLFLIFQIFQNLMICLLALVISQSGIKKLQFSVGHGNVVSV